MKEKRTKAGGVALYDGIIFASKYRQVTIERRNGKIYCRTYQGDSKKNFYEYIPIIRGLFGLGNQIGNSAGKFMDSIGEGEGTSKLYTLCSYVFIIIGLVGIPIGISYFVPEAFRILVQVLGVLTLFGGYLALLQFVPQLKQVYMYHGAEHKAVNAYEKLPFDEINFETVKKQSRIHKRCGGNLVAYFIMLTIAIMFIPYTSLLHKFIFSVAFSILNIGLAFELVEIISILPKPLDIIGLPASLIQCITTKEPTDDMLKLAVYGIRGCGNKMNGITVQKYINRYVESRKLTDYDVMDIYAILEYVLKKDRNTLQVGKNSELVTIGKEIEADVLLDKYYIKHKPLQYITHKQYFFNEEYYVDENVLIPQPDSEILVEKAIEYVNKDESIIRVLDLCTGSGALGISLSKNVERVLDVELIDISDGALEVANKNIIKNEVSDRVCTCKSDLLEEVIIAINNKEAEEQEELKVHMIISNPPYIRSEVIQTLPEDVKQEPHLALDGGEDGLVFYRKIIEQAKEVLLDNGLLIFEIGYDQLEDLTNIIKENKEYELLESVKDYGGNDRVVICRFQRK